MEEVGEREAEWAKRIKSVEFYAPSP
jgi:hypothetical protein